MCIFEEDTLTLKNKDLIRSVLLDHLTDDAVERGTVTVLSGPWGCGKTHLWQHEILSKLKDRGVVTLSLFGLESIAALKTQLMNKCLILKAQSLKKGKFKQTLSGGKNLLLEGFKKTLKGVDSVIGTNLLSWNIDPLQLVDEKLIVCLDDVERISSKVGLDEIFGLTNLLAEHKHCKVLLLMNEEAILEGEGSNAKTMAKYKERVIDQNLQVDTDINSSFDLFIEQYRNQTNIYNYLKAHKNLFIKPILNSEYGNLRTLKKCIDAVSEVLSSNEIELDPKLMPSFVALQIEAAEGKLKDPDFYNFNEMSLMISGKMFKKTKDQGGRQEEQRKFHQLYFGGSEGYLFVKEFYNRIKNGFFDLTSLKKEINPEVPQKDELTTALAVPQSRHWWYFSDEDYSEWVTTIEKYIFSDQAISTSQLVTAIVYLKNACDISGIELNQKTDEIIRERISKNASIGDESFSDERRIFLSQQKSIWEPYLDGYDEKAQIAATEAIIPDIISTIEREDLNSFLNLISQKPKGLQAAISEKSLSALLAVFKKNRMFFNDVVTFIVEELLTYRTTRIIPNIEKRLTQIREFVQSLFDQKGLDNSDRKRLSILLEKIPLVGIANPEAQQS